MPELEAEALSGLESQLEDYCSDALDWTILGQTIRIGPQSSDVAHSGRQGYWENEITRNGGLYRVSLPPRDDLEVLFKIADEADD